MMYGNRVKGVSPQLLVWGIICQGVTCSGNQMSSKEKNQSMIASIQMSQTFYGSSLLTFQSFFLSDGKLKSLLMPPFIFFQAPKSISWFQVRRPTQGWTL